MTPASTPAAYSFATVCFDDLAAVRDDQDAPAVRVGLGDDRGGDDGLAGSGRRDDQHAPAAGGNLGRHPVDHVHLIGPQFWRRPGVCVIRVASPLSDVFPGLGAVVRAGAVVYRRHGWITPRRLSLHQSAQRSPGSRR